MLHDARCICNENKSQRDNLNGHGWMKEKNSLNDICHRHAYQLPSIRLQLHAGT